MISSEQRIPPPVAGGVPMAEENYTALLSHRPPWLVRWGILLFACIIGLLLVATWFIRYPDRVMATGVLMAENAPRNLVIRTEGRLMRLLHADGDSVQQGALLAVMETTADYQKLLDIQHYTDSLLADVLNGHSDAAQHWHNLLHGKAAALHMGELQSDYQQMMQALQNFTQYLSSGYYLRKKAMLGIDLQHIARQRQVLQQQLSLTRQDVSLATENFGASEKLARQQVIAPVEYRNEQSKWLNRKLQLPQLEAAIIANEVQQHEKAKEIALLENEISQQKALFTEALQQWRAKLDGWIQQYLVVAPCHGRLMLHGFVQAGSTFRRGELLGSVQPPNAGYFVAAVLPQYNFGKLKTKQQAHLRFHAYPAEEFGQVEAVLNEIKLLPTDSGYIAKLTLPHGLQTDRAKLLTYQQGLQVGVDILTDDRRLLERLIDGLHKLVQR